jgi:hypothetical protein
MRTVLLLLPVTVGFGALLGCAAPVEWDEVGVGGLVSDSDHVCVPTDPLTSHSVSIVGSDSFTLTGTLTSADGEPLRRGGVEVGLWSLVSDTLEYRAELSVTETDENGTFTVSVDPSAIATFSGSEVDRTAGLGFLIDGKHERWLSPKVLPEINAPAQATCGYWADTQGNFTAGAVLGGEVQLVVRAIGTPPTDMQLRIYEVGTDLSGDDLLASIAGEPFVDGVSTTTWTVAAEAGFLDGNRIELQFTATSGSADYEFGTISDWMFL